MDSKIRVAVLRGGRSPAYEHSLKTGAHVPSLLGEKPEAYDPLDIFISKSGEWHTSGLVQKPEKILKGVHVVWNGIEGSHGEDGQLQQMFENMNIPFTGSSAVSSA